MAEWRNRIVERKRMRVGDLKENRYNPKSHPRTQQERLKAVLDKFGVVGDLVAYHSERNDGALTLFDGHARQVLDPDQEWDVLVSDLTDAEVDELVLYYDPLAALARQEADQTAALMAGLDVQERALREMLEEQAQSLGFVFGKNGKPPEDPGPMLDKAAELQEKWGVCLGDLWTIASKTAQGEHRVVCGDCTDRTVVERVMQGERAALCVTSPPYFNQRPEYAIFASYDEYNCFLSSVVNVIISVSGNPFILAWNTGDNQADCLPMIADQTTLIHRLGLTYLDTIIWKKAGAVYSIPRSAHIRTHRYFYPALSWEPVIIFRRGDKMPQFEMFDVNTVSEFGINVWEINQVIGSQQDKIGHPAIYPEELSSRVLMAYSCKSSMVIDPFLGSGTTLVSCERLGRLGRGVEIEPKYVAVTLERLSQMQLEPRRIE